MQMHDADMAGTDVLGKSGRDLLRALCRGEREPGLLVELAPPHLRDRVAQWKQAFEGHLTEHHGLLLEQLLDHVEYLESQIERLAQNNETRRPRLPDAPKMEPGHARTESKESIFAFVLV